MTSFMKYLFPIIFLFTAGCQGSLTQEQKKEMRDGMKANEIVKISEAEILDAAFLYGRTISKEALQNPELGNQRYFATLQDKYHVKIFPLEPGDSLLMEIEKQLIEAYTSTTSINLTDNVQKIGSDSLLYTLPIMDTLKDGSFSFKYALGIRMPKKDVILSIPRD